MPDWPSLLFLVYLLIFLPWMVCRGGRRLRAAKDGTNPILAQRREAIWYSTIISLLLLFVLSWLVSRTFEFPIFAWPHPSATQVLAAAAALAALLVLRAIARATRS